MLHLTFIRATGDSCAWKGLEEAMHLGFRSLPVCLQAGMESGMCQEWGMESSHENSSVDSVWCTPFNLNTQEGKKTMEGGQGPTHSPFLTGPLCEQPLLGAAAESRYSAFSTRMD